MKISNFEEYNLHRRGKRRWTEPNFAMPREGKTFCGLCGCEFEASNLFFLICRVCVSRNVELEKGRDFVAVVYGLYSMNNELLYIGVTNNPVARAHNHMLTKNFKTLRVIEYFADRPKADDFEKWSICNIKPPLNRLFETDWQAEPVDWDAAVFGKVARVIKTKVERKSGTKPRKKQKPNPTKQKGTKSPGKPKFWCYICTQAISEKNLRVTDDGKHFHSNPCKPPMTPEEKKKARDELKKRNKQVRALNKYQESSVPVIKCRYCHKSVSSGNHMACRRKRLKELGRV